MKKIIYLFLFTLISISCTEDKQTNDAELTFQSKINDGGKNGEGIYLSKP